MLQDPTRNAILNKARLDKFLLVLTLPKVLRPLVSKLARTNFLVNEMALQFSIIGAPIPTTSIPHVDLPFAGQVAKISSMARPTWPPLPIDFTVDNQFTNWWVIWKWLDVINNSQDSIYELTNQISDTGSNAAGIVGTMNDYASNMTVFGRDEFNNNVIQFDYTGCFPTELTPITYNYKTPEEMSATATMQYTQFSASLLDVPVTAA